MPRGAQAGAKNPNWKGGINRHRPTPIQKWARKMTANAVKSGRLLKPEKCAECRRHVSQLTTPIHGHHGDYLRPLVVRWLCSGCHTQWHAMTGHAKNWDVPVPAVSDLYNTGATPPRKTLQNLTRTDHAETDDNA